MKALKAFIKPFEASQRSVTISIQLSEMHGTGRVKILESDVKKNLNLNF